MTTTKDKKRFGCPYKDSRPFDTITTIRNKLHELGILTIENEWHNNCDKLYSCRIVIPEIDVGTNGKGITSEHSLASAYAEFMERLQNNILFPSYFDKKTKDFTSDPNEKIYKSDELPNLPSCFDNAKFITGEKLKDILENIKKDQSTIKSVPFYDVNNDKVQYLPAPLLKSAYGSNGMCAGNTCEEAICQGISEIFERYALKEIYFNEITPPTIPIEYIEENAPTQYKIMKHLEANFSCKIIVKDCSLNKGIPVIATVIYFDKKDKIAIRFGSDPIWQLGLERCLTETFQGKDIAENIGLTSLTFSDEKNEKISVGKFINHFHTGTGTFSTCFFDNKFSYKFNNYKNISFDSHKQKLSYLLNIIKNLNYKLYVKDVSSLGFPSYHVIIPTISEAYPYRVKSQANILKINNCSEEQLKELAKDMENWILNKGETLPLDDYIPVPTTTDSPWNEITVEFLLTLIYYKISEYSKAQEKLSKHIDHAKRVDPNTDCSYHYVAKQFLGLMARYPEDFSRIKKILLQTFDFEIVNEVIADFSDKNKIFQYIPLPNNFDCDNCQAKEFCNYDMQEKILLSVKQKQKQNPINQMLLNKVFK